MSNSRIKKQLWENLIDAQCGICMYSGEIMKPEISNHPLSASLDHIKPKEKGGNTSPNNLILCCRKYNLEKNAQNLESWWVKKPFYSKNRQKILELYQSIPNLSILKTLMENYGNDQIPLEGTIDEHWINLMYNVLDQYV